MLDNSHHPIAYQICGHKPFMMKDAAKRLSEVADIIDINMGCPVRKVVCGHDGSALMREPELAYDIVQAVKDGTDLPVSVKFRLGFTASEMNYVEFGQKMQDAGAEFITIHARTRLQMYSGKADWAKIKDLKKAYELNQDFVICNYMIASNYDALKKYKEAIEYYEIYANSDTPDDDYKKYAKARAEELKENAGTTAKK